MIKSVAAEFVLLAGKFGQVCGSKYFAARDGASHKAEGGVVGPDKTVFSKNCASVEQSRLRKIVEGERDDGCGEVNAAGTATEPTREATLERFGNSGVEIHKNGCRNEDERKD